MYWEILGIEPTSDIKKIKAAYAGLAKKYNPEEHPEEFKRVYSAYKAACAYAKRFPAEKGSGLKPAPAENMSAAEENKPEYSFSGVDPYAKRESAAEQEPEDGAPEYTFPEISGAAHRKEAEPETSEHSQDFSFDGIDRNAKIEGTPEPVPDKEEFDFTRVGAEGKKDEPCAEKETGSEEKYDFSGIKADINSGSDSYSEVQKRRKLLSRIREILSNPETAGSRNEWREFFELPEFEDMSEDYDFRCGVCEALYGSFFSKDTAHFIADGFGYGSRAVPTDYYCGRWQAAITVRTSPAAAGKKREASKRRKSGYKVRNGLVIGFIVLSVILRAYLRFEGSSADEYTSAETVVQEVYSDSDELQEALFEMLAESRAKRYSEAVGKWKFSFGTIEFYSDNSFEMINDKGVFTGTAASVPSEYSGTVKITLSDSGSDVDGTYVILRDFEDGRKYAVYYDNEGNMTGPGTIEE